MQTISRLGSRLGLAVFVCLGLNLLGTQPSFAAATFRLMPMNMNLEPSGRGATQSFQVKSTGDEPVAVQVHMAVRQMGLDGTETYPQAEDDFLVYPPQILLKPGELQTVRVTWLGDPRPAKELAYRIIAEQLPINLDKVEQTQRSGLGVQIKALFRYIGSVYIIPKNVAPKLVLDSVKHEKGKSGANDLAFTFQNQGTAHALLRGLNLHLTPVGQDGKSAQGATVHLKPEQLEGVSGENILAGNKRQFVISWPAGLPVGPITATFDVDQNR